MAATIGQGHLPAAPRGNPAQRVVVSFHDYADAEGTVDYLLDQGFPAGRVAIVASDLRFVEHLAGRVGYADAAANGAAAGAAIGALFGFVAGVLNWVDPLVTGLALALYGLVLGGLAGAVAGAALHALGRRRGFSSHGRLEARRYDVMVDEARATEAVKLLEARRHGGPPHDGAGPGGDPPPEAA